MAGPDPVASRLSGNVYRGADASRPVRPFVVIQDAGGERVVVETLDPPYSTRHIQRRRLSTYHYELIGRVDRNGSQVQRVLTPPPKFDGPGFAKWLRKWMDAEGIAVDELAERAGLSSSMIHMLRRGMPSNNVRRKSGQDALHPAIESIAAIAHGLGLEFAYVASRAGIGDHAGRWANFTKAERIALSIALGGKTDEDDLDSLLDKAVQPIKPREPVS